MSANANAATAAHSHTLADSRCRGADPGYLHQEGKKHEIIFLLFNYVTFFRRAVLVGETDRCASGQLMLAVVLPGSQSQVDNRHFNGCLITQVNSGIAFESVFLKWQLTANR